MLVKVWPQFERLHKTCLLNFLRLTAAQPAFLNDWVGAAVGAHCKKLGKGFS